MKVNKKTSEISSKGPHLKPTKTPKRGGAKRRVQTKLAQRRPAQKTGLPVSKEDKETSKKEVNQEPDKPSNALTAAEQAKLQKERALANQKRVIQEAQNEITAKKKQEAGSTQKDSSETTVDFDLAERQMLAAHQGIPAEVWSIIDDTFIDKLATEIGWETNESLRQLGSDREAVMSKRDWLESFQHVVNMPLDQHELIKADSPLNNSFSYEHAYGDKQCQLLDGVFNPEVITGIMVNYFKRMSNDLRIALKNPRAESSKACNVQPSKVENWNELASDLILVYLNQGLLSPDKAREAFVYETKNPAYQEIFTDLQENFAELSATELDDSMWILDHRIKRWYRQGKYVFKNPKAVVHALLEAPKTIFDSHFFREKLRTASEKIKLQGNTLVDNIANLMQKEDTE